MHFNIVYTQSASELKLTTQTPTHIPAEVFEDHILQEINSR